MPGLDEIIFLSDPGRALGDVWYMKKIREIADGSCFINGCVRGARK